jgi:hypothetical protein
LLSHHSPQVTIYIMGVSFIWEREHEWSQAFYLFSIWSLVIKHDLKVQSWHFVTLLHILSPLSHGIKKLRSTLYENVYSTDGGVYKIIFQYHYLTSCCPITQPNSGSRVLNKNKILIPSFQFHPILILLPFFIQKLWSPSPKDVSVVLKMSGLHQWEQTMYFDQIFC